jgi:dihydrofolate reductase
MRKIIVTTTISLDGVMQGPGGPKEDTSNGFKYGGWAGAFGDETFGKEFAKELAQTDYLLGSRTYDIFAGYWPEHAEFWPGINEGMKYVVSDKPKELTWKNEKLITGDDILGQIKELKESDGADLQVWGSSVLVQLLLENDLVDELWLKIIPVTLGSGKKLFAEGTKPAAFKLTHSVVTPGGVTMNYYARDGEIKIDTIQV